MRSKSFIALGMLVLTLGLAPASNAADDPIKAVKGAVQLGAPVAAEVSLTELVVEVPVTVKPVGIGGRVESVTFTDLALNGIPFEVDPYTASFDLPEDGPVTLPEPLRLRVRFADVAPGVFEQAIMPNDALRVTGKVTVDGTYRKWMFSVKRAVEVPIDVSRPNPLAEYHPLKLALAELRTLDTRGWRLPF